MESGSDGPYARPVTWHVYVLLSATTGTTYAGSTTDAERRLAQHNGELPGGAKATRAGRPWQLAVLYGPFADRAEAQAAEYQVKRLRGPERLRWDGTPSSAP